MTVAGDTVTVTTVRAVPTEFLKLIGIGTLHVTGSATAAAESGFTAISGGFAIPKGCLT